MKLQEFMSASMQQSLLLKPSGFPLMKNIGATHRTLTMGVENIPSDWIKTNIGQRRYLLANLYMISYMTSEVRAAITTIRNEVFRRGLMGFVPKFDKKCTNPNCGDEESTGDVCRLCGSPLRSPDVSQIIYPKKLFKRCNRHGQTLEDVLKEAHDDVNIADDAFILLNKEYAFSKEGLISRTSEIYRLHPGLVEFDVNSAGEVRSAHYTCRLHRELSDGPGKCPKCNLEMEPVMFIYHQTGGDVPLFDDEIIHFQKFTPGILYGLSPLLTLFEKVLTVLGMDKYVYRYFFERKMPSSMLITATDDTEGLRREREYLEMRLRQDPDYIPWVGVTARTGRGRTDLIRLYHTLQEMDYLPVRQEIRERISAFYGVTPIWENSTAVAGGVAQQSMSMIVTSRVVESDQRLYHTKVFPELLEEGFGVTDWDLRLYQPEEKAESTRIQFSQQRAGVASVLQKMGFKVKIIGDKANLDDVVFQVENPAGGYPIPLDSLNVVPTNDDSTSEKTEAAATRGGEMADNDGNMHRHPSRPYPHSKDEKHKTTQTPKEEAAVLKPVEGSGESNVFPGEVVRKPRET